MCSPYIITTPFAKDMDSNLFSKFWITLARPENAKVAFAVAVIPLLACIIKLVISDLMYTSASVLVGSLLRPV